MHLVIPFAAPGFPQGLPALPMQQLPNLQVLLRELAIAPIARLPEGDLSMPHEHVRAGLLGIACDARGNIPWAAVAAAATRQGAGDAAFAWISPVHLIAGSNHIQLVDPAQLNLASSESMELLQAMAPYFKQDGIDLEYESPGRWLARGSVFEALASASLDRAAGRDIRPWMPDAAPLRRLQSEMQMLLYTHTVNDARQARGAMAVNSFWIHGSGCLPAGRIARPAGELVEAGALRQPALLGDADAWQAAWKQIDAAECRALCQALGDPEQNASMTLCGARASIRLGPARRGLVGRLQARLRPVTLAQLLEPL